jgi:hypothetical protein
MNDKNDTNQEHGKDGETVYPSGGAGTEGGDKSGGEASEGGKDQSTDGMTGSSVRPSSD